MRRVGWERESVSERVNSLDRKGAGTVLIPWTMSITLTGPMWIPWTSKPTKLSGLQDNVAETAGVDTSLLFALEHGRKETSYFTIVPCHFTQATTNFTVCHLKPVVLRYREYSRLHKFYYSGSEVFFFIWTVHSLDSNHFEWVHIPHSSVWT